MNHPKGDEWLNMPLLLQYTSRRSHVCSLVTSCVHDHMRKYMHNTVYEEQGQHFIILTKKITMSNVRFLEVVVRIIAVVSSLQSESGINK